MTQPSTSRFLGVGYRVADAADHTATTTAAAEALTEALAGRAPTLVFVFCSTSYDLEALIGTICAGVADDVHIVGGTTLGELAPSGPGPVQAGWERGVLVMALGGPGFEAQTVVVPNASADRYLAGAAAAAAMEGLRAPHQVMLMLADGLTREQHELVRGSYAVLGLDVSIVGGCTGDELEYRATYQFHGTGAGVEVHSDSIVAIGLGSSEPIGIGIDHGWEKRGEPMMVTSSEGGVVYTLDGKPAADVYLQAIGESHEILDDVNKFRDVSFANPLGLSRRSGADIRVVHDIDAESGAVICLADVPQGALVWTMTSDVESLLDAARTSANAAIAGLGGADLLGLVVFDCGARKSRLGREHLPAEQAALAEASGGRPFGGFYTFGEIARTQGSRGMHHFTVVTMALA